jgi:hypothetical protein
VTVPRWLVKAGTGKDAVTAGFVVCRVGEGYRAGGYWQAMTLYGHQIGSGRPFRSRREAANALLLHTQQQP